MRYFYDKVYDVNDLYDLRLDSEANNPKECARIIREAVETTEPIALRQLYEQLC